MLSLSVCCDISSPHKAFPSDHVPLTTHASWLPHAVTLLFIPPLSDEGQSCVYLARPPPHLSPLWLSAAWCCSTLESCPKPVWRLATWARWRQIPRVSFVDLAEQPHSRHRFSKADFQNAIGENGVNGISTKWKAVNCERTGTIEKMGVPAKRWMETHVSLSDT